MPAKTLTADELKASANFRGINPSAFFSQLYGQEVFAIRQEDLKWAVCSENEFTKRLDEFAQNVATIEAFREGAGVCDPEWLGAVFGSMISGGPYSLRRFADAMDECNSKFAKTSYEDQAAIHLLNASRILYMEYHGAGFFKADLKEKAQLLWAHAKQCSVDNLPDPNWTRLYKKVGLKGIKNGKPGPRPKS
jgi:hypothetical protein